MGEVLGRVEGEAAGGVEGRFLGDCHSNLYKYYQFEKLREGEMKKRGWKND